MAQQLQDQDQYRSHTYLVEVILKPTNNIYGYGQTETTTLLRVVGVYLLTTASWDRTGSIYWILYYCMVFIDHSLESFHPNHD